MNRFHSLSQFKFDVWLIEQLRNAPFPGLTLGELRHRWQDVPGRKANLSRDMLTAHRKSIREFLGVEIQTPDRMHYRIVNSEALALDTLANDLMKSIQNFVFLQEYKELGNLIQPEQIETGACYLSQIGQALRDKRKLKITYQKFGDPDPYDAIVHPYCLMEKPSAFDPRGQSDVDPRKLFYFDPSKVLTGGVIFILPCLLLGFHLTDAFTKEFDTV